MEFKVTRHTPQSLSHNQYGSLGDLFQSVWPQAEYDREASIEYGKKITSIARFIVWDGETAVAQAGYSPHTIYYNDKAFEVAALKGVCVLPEYQGKGLGADVVRAAFEEATKLNIAVVLLQTGVPDFYKKLNCRHIQNAFFNSQNKEDQKANPWWEKNIMIYPADAVFPEGPIDLNGQGF